MKRVVTLLILVLLPFSVSVDAGVKFETYNASDLSWDVDTTCSAGSLYFDLTLDDVSDFSPALTDSIISTFWTSTDIVTPQKLKHDTLREYITGLDTVIVLHRIECDTNFTKFFVENDSTFVQIQGIECDTIFRVDFRDIWASKVQVYLDSTLWHELMRILEEVKDE